MLKLITAMEELLVTCYLKPLFIKPLFIIMPCNAPYKATVIKKPYNHRYNLHCYTFTNCNVLKHRLRLQYLLLAVYENIEVYGMGISRDIVICCINASLGLGQSVVCLVTLWSLSPFSKVNVCANLAKVLKKCLHKYDETSKNDLRISKVVQTI